ncbi:hypothetical protein GCM10020358_00650 [Amorphoplanes nipponensis]|uniref:Uncharacterized protein n=1 Tax=Actinoplanes nipponensis TaxID=135950 RepID=A0A919JGX6_9ACTN|nr:hypothetical protein [Actinoplanes nipponensis]GIE49180.1 hypothetical protein Ani05nite_27140 [Actinoplanes nipponensis]
MPSTPYTSERPPRPESNDQLRARIPGWGVDLDPRDRPAVPKERLDPALAGAPGEFPARQPEEQPRERSIEHAELTPVFGTSCPPKGLSGVIRRYAYGQYSEGRAAHWLLLLAADRVDTVESTLRSFVSTRPDNPITQTGVLSEFTHHGIGSRFGRKRADVNHQWLDPIIVGAPWLLAGALAYRIARRVAGR